MKSSANSIHPTTAMPSIKVLTPALESAPFLFSTPTAAYCPLSKVCHFITITAHGGCKFIFFQQAFRQMGTIRPQ